MKKRVSFYLVFLLILSAPFAGLAEKLDPARPPTDDLDYEEIQQKISAMLPETPDLLKFSVIHTFRFSGWPGAFSAMELISAEPWVVIR